MIGLSVRTFFTDERTFRQFTRAPADAGADTAAAAAVPAGSGRFRAQINLLRRDGSVRWVDLSGLALGGDDADTLWLLTDITELRQYQEQIEYLAYHDGLTGLPNRLLLSDRLTQSLALARRHQRAIVVCYLDLDGFKAVNDAHGHPAGDLLLQTVARRLQAALRVNDTVCRVGGDEFVLVLTHLDQVLHYEAVLGRVGAEIAKPVELGHDQFGQVSASMGVALFPQDGDDPDRLLRCADQAMYRAKQRGRQQICRYDETVD
jgi:diguanylate cyclase (GGDEF)-like protein